jgi:CRP-like cAMP-binding protein
MRSILRDHIVKRLGTEPADLDRVLSLFESRQLKRGMHLLETGQICRHVYFIVKGCLQVYVLDQQGRESTRELYVEEQWVTDVFGFQHGTPSTEAIKCLEPCQLLCLNRHDFARLSSEVPAFAQVYQQILEISYNNTVYRVNTLTSLDALERMRWLMDHKPHLMSRLSSKVLASYLGISPETMTRLKARL